MTDPIRYQLVIQFPDNYFESWDDMIKFEDRLINCMPRTCTVDGHDTGSGTINFFIYTAYPNAAFLAFRKYLGINKVMKKIRVAFRDETKDDYTNLWPKRDLRPFQISYR